MCEKLLMNVWESFLHCVVSSHCHAQPYLLRYVEQDDLVEIPPSSACTRCAIGQSINYQLVFGECTYICVYRSHTVDLLLNSSISHSYHLSGLFTIGSFLVMAVVYRLRVLIRSAKRINLHKYMCTIHSNTLRFLLHSRAYSAMNYLALLRYRTRPQIIRNKRTMVAYSLNGRSSQ
jgi:hypothetical protein